MLNSLAISAWLKNILRNELAAGPRAPFAERAKGVEEWNKRHIDPQRAWPSRVLSSDWSGLRWASFRIHIQMERPSLCPVPLLIQTERPSLCLVPLLVKKERRWSPS